MRLTATTMTIGLVVTFVLIGTWWLITPQQVEVPAHHNDQNDPQEVVLTPSTVEAPLPQPTALEHLESSATTNPDLVRLVDKESRDRFSTDVAYAVPVVEADDEQAAVVAVLLDHTDSDTARHQAAELLRRSRYAALPETLVAVLANAQESERFRSWAVQHLYNVFAQSGAEDQTLITTTLSDLLDDRHIAVQREALLSLSRLSDPAAVEHAAAWLSNEQSTAKDLALRILRENDARQHINVVRNLAHADDQSTRIAALVTLSQWGDEHSRGAMYVAANLPDTNANFRLRRCGRMALERLDRALAANETSLTETP